MSDNDENFGFYETEDPVYVPIPNLTTVAAMAAIREKPYLTQYLIKNTPKTQQRFLKALMRCPTKSDKSGHIYGFLSENTHDPYAQSYWIKMGRTAQHQPEDRIKQWQKDDNDIYRKMFIVWTCFNSKLECLTHLLFHYAWKERYINGKRRIQWFYFNEKTPAVVCISLLSQVMDLLHQQFLMKKENKPSINVGPSANLDAQLERVRPYRPVTERLYVIGTSYSTYINLACHVVGKAQIKCTFTSAGQPKLTIEKQNYSSLYLLQKEPLSSSIEDLNKAFEIWNRIHSSYLCEPLLIFSELDFYAEGAQSVLEQIRRCLEAFNITNLLSPILNSHLTALVLSASPKFNDLCLRRAIEEAEVKPCLASKVLKNHIDFHFVAAKEGPINVENASEIVEKLTRWTNVKGPVLTNECLTNWMGLHVIAQKVVDQIYQRHFQLYIFQLMADASKGLAEKYEQLMNLKACLLEISSSMFSEKVYKKLRNLNTNILRLNSEESHRVFLGAFLKLSLSRQTQLKLTTFFDSSQVIFKETELTFNDQIQSSVLKAIVSLESSFNSRPQDAIAFGTSLFSCKDDIQRVRSVLSQQSAASQLCRVWSNVDKIERITGRMYNLLSKVKDLGYRLSKTKLPFKASQPKNKKTTMSPQQQAPASPQQKPTQASERQKKAPIKSDKKKSQATTQAEQSNTKPQGMQVVSKQTYESSLMSKLVQSLTTGVVFNKCKGVFNVDLPRVQVKNLTVVLAEKITVSQNCLIQPAEKRGRLVLIAKAYQSADKVFAAPNFDHCLTIIRISRAASHKTGEQGKIVLEYLDSRHSHSPPKFEEVSGLVGIYERRVGI